MRVFVTGVAGLVGSHIAERFRDLGHDVRGIDNLASGAIDNVPDGIDFRQADCLNSDAYRDSMWGADIVYHCACTAYDGFSVVAPAFVYRNTAQATVEVASAAVAAGVGHFVHCSSMARYGDRPSPFVEDVDPAPVTPYGLAKHASELIVRNLFETHGGTYSIAVPHNIIGARQRFTDPYRSVAAIMINRMLRGHQPVIYGDGSQRRCFSFIQDVLDCLERMGTWTEAHGEVINVGPDEGAVTILELAETIAGLLDFSLDPIFEAPRPLEVGEAVCSSDKARRLLKYETRYTLEDGLREMVEWITRTGPREFRYDFEAEINSQVAPLSWRERVL